MEWLKNYAMILVLLSLIAAVSEMLLSNTPYQKYVKVLAGLVMVIAVISPFLNLTGQELSLDGYEGAAAEDYQQYYRSAVERGVLDQLEEVAREALEQQGIDLKEIDVTFSYGEEGEIEAIEAVQITCDPPEDQAAGLVAQAFGIETAQVTTAG